MNCETTFTRSEQRIAQLIALKRPLTDGESEELYRALHADYMRQWRAAKRRNDRARRDLELSVTARSPMLEKMRAEARQPEWYEERC